MSDPISPYVAGRTRGMLAVVVVAVGGLFGYVLHQRNVVNRVSSENEQMVSLLKDTRAQMASLSSKLDAIAAPQPQQSVMSPGGDVQKPSPAQIHRRPASVVSLK